MTSIRSSNRDILIAEEQKLRLQDIIDSALIAPGRSPERIQNLRTLKEELDRAQLRPITQLPESVVRVESWVEVEDISDGFAEQFQLVYPEHADLAENRISMLTPLGIAVLGQREGDKVEYQAPGGTTRIRIRKVSQKPLESCAPDPQSFLRNYNE